MSKGLTLLQTTPTLILAMQGVGSPSIIGKMHTQLQPKQGIL